MNILSVYEYASVLEFTSILKSNIKTLKDKMR